MTDSRRDFLIKAGASGLALHTQGARTAAAVARPEAVCRVNILTNHVGYLTRGAKKFLVESNVYSIKPDFYVRDLSMVGDHRVFHGRLQEFQGDFGGYYVGDFSELTRSGKYALDLYRDGLPSSDFISSYVFTVADDYHEVIQKGIDCFAVQRCGPSTTGYHAPCHLDDGVRLDNGVVLSMQYAQRPGASMGATWLVLMQVLGLLAGVLTLAIATPLANRMAYLALSSLEKGAKDPRADRVRGRLALVSSVSGAMILVTLYFAANHI